MTETEYNYLQSVLSNLVSSERLRRKVPHEKYRETYVCAVLDCKSKLHEVYNTHKKQEDKT